MKIITYQNHSIEELTNLDHSETLLAEMASNNAKNVSNFELEINEDLAEVRERVEVIRRKISDHRASPDNFSGFLRFDVDTYIGDFEIQIAKVNDCLHADREFWENEAN